MTLLRTALMRAQGRGTTDKKGWPARILPTRAPASFKRLLRSGDRTPRAPSTKVRSEVRTDCDHLLNPSVDLFDVFGGCGIIPVNHPAAPKCETPSLHFDMLGTSNTEPLGEAARGILIGQAELEAELRLFTSLEP